MAYQYQQYTPSNSVKNYKQRQDTATNTYNNYANQGYSQGAGGLGVQVDSAQAKLAALYRGNNLTQQFKYGNQRQYDQALKNVANRKAFSYDLSNDTLFQQAKEQYQTLGKTAMADTIGQASAMTGGYGNSYAATAGNQAYQNYLTELNNSVGDYYAMALNAYNSESDRLNNVFSALSNDRSAQQGEWKSNWDVYNNLYNLYQSEYSDLLGKDVTAWQQKGSNLYNSANLATSQYSTASQNDINVWDKQENLKATQASQLETERHNRETEDYNNRSLAETIRSNQASEAHNNRVLSETQRHNQAVETETTRSNKATESINRTRYSTSNSSNSNGAVTAVRTAAAVELKNRIDSNMNRRGRNGGTQTLTSNDIRKIIDNADLSKEAKAWLYNQYGF